MKKKLLLIFLSLSFPLILLVVLEVSARFAKVVYESWIREEVILPEDRTTFTDLPDGFTYRLDAVRMQGEELIWKASYRINKSLGTRLPFIDTFKEGDQEDRHINLLGGSFTFGVNLNDEDTLAGHFSRELSNKTKVNNFGIPGGGPHNTLELLDGSLNSFASKSVGVSYYFFIDDHVPRALIDMHHIGDFYESAFYKVNNDKEVIYAGVFSKVYPLWARFLKLCSSSLFLRKVGFNPPLGEIRDASKKQSQRICHLLNGVKDRVLNIFPKTSFKVVFLPEAGVSHYLLSDCLERGGVEYLNLTNLLDKKLENRTKSWKNYFFPDHHPKSIYNKVLTDEIIKLDSLK